jgi:hypothetical protein
MSSRQTDFTISTLLLGAGFMLGLVALGQTWHFRETGLFAKAFMGIVINGVFIAVMVLFFPWMASGRLVTPPSAGQAKAPAAVASGRNEPAAIPLATYNQDGIRFSYDNRLTVIDRPEITNAEMGVHLGRLILVTDQNENYGVYIASIPFDPARANPSLELCARFVLFTTLGVRNVRLENYMGDLGGSSLPGVIQCAFAARQACSLATLLRLVCDTVALHILKTRHGRSMAYPFQATSRLTIHQLTRSIPGSSHCRAGQFESH